MIGRDDRNHILIDSVPNDLLFKYFKNICKTKEMNGFNEKHKIFVNTLSRLSVNNSYYEFEKYLQKKFKSDDRTEQKQLFGIYYLFI